ncbi:MAG: DUF4271 domain-containing protein [Bacteroides sp.]|nr:DUF4271 domain-containing protein [Bacteroides sp.]
MRSNIDPFNNQLPDTTIADSFAYENTANQLDSKTIKYSESIVSVVTKDEKVKYNPRGDDGIAIILLLSFFVSAILIGKNKKGIVQRIRDFFLNKERSSLFSQGLASQSALIVYFSIQTALLLGVFFLNFFYDLHINFIDDNNSLIILGIYTSIIGIYLLFKQVIYRFIAWMFFDSKQHELWLISYNTLVAFFSFILYPSLLFIIYFDLEFNYVILLGLSLFFIMKLVMFYKWINLFLNDIYGLLRLFLYFCALEILPCLIVYQGLVQVNNQIIIKL